jgi:transposase
MELTPIYDSAIGLDVHQRQITACAITTDTDGRVRVERREFGTFKRDRRALAKWCKARCPGVVVMESTGIYWKSPYAALERAGIRALVVNARHIKTVPGRKTDMADAQWLAILARSGLLRGSFIPPEDLRHLRLVARQRHKISRMLAAEKNRTHKVLADGGIRLSAVVSDLHGQSARAMVQALVDGQSPEQVMALASRRLKAPREDLLASLDGELSDDHRFVLAHLLDHINQLETRIRDFDTRLLAGLEGHRDILELLQTLPGMDRIGAAMLLVEIGTEMDAFGSAERLASWVGICPGNNESAGKRKSGRTRKGNPHVRRLLCEFAHAASRTRCGLQARYQSLAARRGSKRAIVALAHKILRIIFFMISRRDYYRDSDVDYEAMMVERNAPRWIRMLNRYGYLNQPA